MSGKKIIMTKQSEVLRLKSLGHSKSEVTRLLGIDRATVRRYWDGPHEAVEIIRDTPLWVERRSSEFHLAANSKSFQM